MSLTVASTRECILPLRRDVGIQTHVGRDSWGSALFVMRVQLSDSDGLYLFCMYFYRCGTVTLPLQMLMQGNIIVDLHVAVENTMWSRKLFSHAEHPCACKDNATVNNRKSGLESRRQERSTLHSWPTGR